MKRLLCCLLLLIAAGAIGIQSMLDSAVKDAVVRHATRLTGTAVTLESAHLSLWSGKGELHGLNVPNPPGYESPSALHIETVAIDFAPERFFSGEALIHTIAARNARIVYEVTQNGDNIRELRNTIRRNVSTNTSPGTENPLLENSPLLPRTMKVEQITLQDSTLLLAFRFLGGSSQQTLEVPNLTLSGPGAGTSPVTAGELTKTLAETVQKNIVAIRVDIPKQQLDNIQKDIEKSAPELLGNTLGKSVSR